MKNTNSVKKNTNSNPIKFCVDRGAQLIPQNTYNYSTNKDVILENGNNNDYAYNLLFLYENCGVHKSICNQKASFIISNGFRYKEGEEINDLLINPHDTVLSFMNKIILDYIIFNYFYVEIVYNKLGQPLHYYHVPAQYVNTNQSKSTFRFRINDNVADQIFYEPFDYNGDNPTIFAHFGNNPKYNLIYPAPSYSGGLVSMETKVLLDRFSFKSIKNGFTLKNILSFKNGNLTEDQKEKYFREMEEIYTGENGLSFILEFLNINEEAVQVQSLPGGDWNKEFAEINKAMTDNILNSHALPSQVLFGIKQEGSLGNASEMETAYQIFQSTYCEGVRQELVGLFRDLFKNSATIKDEIEFIERPSLYNNELDLEDKMKFMTINEIRQEFNLPPIETGNIIMSSNSDSNKEK